MASTTKIFICQRFVLLKDKLLIASKIHHLHESAFLIFELGILILIFFILVFFKYKGKINKI